MQVSAARCEAPGCLRGPARLHEALEEGDDVLHVRDLAVGDEDTRRLELAQLGLLRLDEVRRDEPAVCAVGEVCD